MRHCDTLITPRWCVPVAPPGTVLDDVSVAVSNGRIVDVLPRADALETYQPSATIDRPHHLLLPGLVNAHTHAAMTLLRGIADDMPLERWLKEGIWPAEKRWASAEMVRDGTELAIAEMLLGGQTCFSDQYFFPDIIAETAIDCHMRAMVGTPVIDFPTAWASTPAEYLRKATERVHDPYVSHPLVSTCFVPHAVYSLSDETFVELRVLADQLDRPVQIHLHETEAEITDSVAQHGRRPIERLDELGLVNASLLAVHAVHMNAREIELMANAGVSVAHCPTSNLKLASGIAPVAEFQSAGITIALGTDGAASNNRLDLLSEMRLAALVGKTRAGDAAAIGAEDALHMATLGGARALGLADEIGSIENGKWADLICVDLARCNSQPVYNAVSQLVYAATADQVSDVWVAGKQQVDNGRLTTINVDTIFDRCNEWRDRIARE